MKKTPLRKRSLNSQAKLANRLWELCKILTRQVYGYKCYTCGAKVQYPHTGHFITDSTCSTELSYDLKNLRPQCYPCNIHHSGNWIIFERNLIQDHGQEYVDELKKRNQATKGLKYDSLWFKAKIAEYEALVEE